MRLTKLFILTTGVVLTLVTIMLVRSVLQEWRIVNAAERGLKAMEITYRAMVAAEKVSFERAPTIAVLGDNDWQDAGKQAQLAAVRKETNAAFEMRVTAACGADQCRSTSRGDTTHQGARAIKTRP
jgi:hypothetical protein